MDSQQLLDCERSCTRLCHDFAWAVDTRRYELFASLFTPDGIFDRAGQTSRGQAQILKFLNARPVGKVTRHVNSNIRISMTGPETATGNCYTLVFGAELPPGTEVKLPLPSALPMLVEYEDDYVLTPDGWKFGQRRVNIVFQP